MRSFKFSATGTIWKIDWKPVAENPKAIEFEIIKLIEIFEKKYSRFIKDSWLNKISKNPGRYDLDNESKVFFDTYYKFYNLSEGIFTPLIAQNLIDAGYSGVNRNESKTLTIIPKWEDCIDYRPDKMSVEIKSVCSLDFGGVGKGFLIDLVSNYFVDNGITKFTIDAGQDIFTKNNPIRIGLEHPLDTTKAIGVVVINNQSICGSAGNRRKFKTHHHIIDPKELKSPDKRLSVWVIAKDSILADTLSTSIFLTGPERYLDMNFEYCILNSDYTISKSTNFSGELFYAS